MMDDLVIAFGLRAAAAVLQALLLVVILYKAGFGWALSILGLAPAFGFAVDGLSLFFGVTTPTEAASLSLVISLLPFLLLAFGTWPRAAGRFPRSETFQ